MPKYRATVQVSGLTGDGPRAVRSALDEQLRKSGFDKSRVVSVEIDAPVEKPAVRRPVVAGGSTRPANRRIDPGGLLLVGAAVLAIWFLWSMLMGAPE
jgi:hypothetical protein